jgi:protein-disulfide isomerase
MRSEHSELFSKKFLVILLTFSILTNIILLRERYPNILNKIQVALLPAPEVLPSDHVRGNANAKYTVIEYAEFQCGYCAQFHEAMSTIMKESDVRWVYRHFPLKAHPLAQKAAEAAECAGEQGKFWEYADSLFLLKGTIEEDTFLKTARGLGLDWLSFTMCLNTGKKAEVVAAQHADGIKKKIDGTPTFYLNGKRFDGFVPIDKLRNMMGVKGKG